MTVTFATSCFEGDWKQILLNKEYLKNLQMGNHNYPFAERLLVINNVSDLEKVKKAAEKRVAEGTLDRYVIATEDVLSRLELKRADFPLGDNAEEYGVTDPDWVYFNALAPFTAIDRCTTDYLLYQTGDVYLKKKVSWIPKAIRCMEKNETVAVANLTWNQKYQEAKKEAVSQSWNFFWADEGFSDQQFLVKTELFKCPIYGEIRADSAHFPVGDIFEKRVYSYLKTHGLRRITYKWGSYTHENI